MNKWNKELLTFILIAFLVIGVMVFVVIFVPDEEALKIDLPVSTLVGLGGFWAVIHNQNKKDK